MATAAKPKGGNALTRKLGPLPVWVWAAAGLAVAWFVFFRSAGSAPAQATQAGPAAARPGGGSGSSSQGGGDSSPPGIDSALLAQLAAAAQTGGGGGEGVTAGEAGGTGGTSSQAAVDAGAAPSSVQQNGTAADPTVATSTSTTSADYIVGQTTSGGFQPINPITGGPVELNAAAWAANPALFDAPAVSTPTTVQGTTLKVA